MKLDAPLRVDLRPAFIGVKEPPKAAGEIPADDYILTPGPHKNDQDNHVERSNADFAGQVLSRLPADGVVGYKEATGANETPSVTHSNIIRQVVVGVVVQAD